MVTPSSKKLILKAFAALKNKYGSRRPPKKRHVFEQLLIQTVGGDASDSDMHLALTKLREDYIDWNEIRISNEHELARSFKRSGLSETLEKARRLKRVLQDIFQFERKFTFEILDDMTPEQVQKFFPIFPKVSAAEAAVTIHYSLGYPSMPVDSHLARVMKRLGAMQPGDSMLRVKKQLEEFIPPDSMYVCYRLFHEMGKTVCTPDKYDCFSCMLKKQCKTGAKAKKPKPVKKKVAKKPVKKSAKTSSRKVAKKVAKKATPKKKSTAKNVAKKSVKKIGSTKKSGSKKVAKKTAKKVAKKKTRKK